MKSLLNHFVRYPILANVLIILTLVAGLVSFLNTKKSFFPTVKDRIINIQVVYPGASPEEMEEGVTLKIEEAVKNIAGVDEITSISSENSASITIVTLDQYDIDEVYTEVKNAIDGISSFPQNAEKPIIFKQKQRSTALWVGLTGDVDLMTLKRFGEDIEDDLIASGKISQISVSGFNAREITIEVSEADLERYNLTFDEVANAVRQNNRDISAGSIKAEREEILIRSSAKETDADLIGEITLRSNEDGSVLKLREVASVREQFADQPNKATLNGKEAVFIQVNKLEEEDLQEISEYVHNYVDEFNEKNTNLQLRVTWDFMDMLQQRFDMLVSNGVIGLVLVLLALGLFLSLRLSFWVAWGIPSSFLGMFILGSFFGLTINMISLFGMILVVGILVDDGIVIAENIYSHFERHHDALRAAVEGTLEVIPAVFTSVLTTIVAFTPLLFLTGGMAFLSDMAIVVIFSLLFSLVEAFFILPAHLASKKVLSKKSDGSKSQRFRNKITKGIDFVRFKVYGHTLRLFMKYKITAACLMLGFFVITAGLFEGGFIKSTFFPNIPFNSFNINVAFTPGTREQKVEAYIKRFEKAVWKVNEELKTDLNVEEDIINYTFSSVGRTGDGSESGSHAGNVNVFYKELDDYGINSFDIIARLNKEIGPMPEAEKFNIGGNNRWGKPVSVRLLGKNYEELALARDFIETELEAMPELKDIQDNIKVGNRELELELSPEAYFLGLTHNDITKQIRQGFFGEEVQRLQKGNDEVRVWVRYPGSGRLNLGQLENMKVKSTSGQKLPLTELADYSIERGVSGINHYAGGRAVTIEAELVDAFAPVPPILEKVQTDIVPRMEALFPSVSVDYGGQARESARTQAEIKYYFSAALILMFFIISVTFRSFYQAFIIMLMIPIGWMCATWGHGLEQIPVSILSAWGMIALSGVIINDAVVFLSKYNSLVEEGHSVTIACYEAGVARFRPIMLTSLTTVAGLFPLIRETSFQAQYLIPMAISVAYGVMFGTLFILLFFPVLILVMNDFRRAMKWLWTGKKPSREEVERVIIDMERVEEFKKIA